MHLRPPDIPEAILYRRLPHPLPGQVGSTGQSCPNLPRSPHKALVTTLGRPQFLITLEVSWVNRLSHWGLRSSLCDRGGTRVRQVGYSPWVGNLWGHQKNSMTEISNILMQYFKNPKKKKKQRIHNEKNFRSLIKDRIQPCIWRIQLPPDSPESPPWSQ